MSLPTRSIEALRKHDAEYFCLIIHNILRTDNFEFPLITKGGARIEVLVRTESPLPLYQNVFRKPNFYCVLIAQRHNSS